MTRLRRYSRCTSIWPEGADVNGRCRLDAKHKTLDGFAVYHVAEPRVGQRMTWQLLPTELLAYSTSGHDLEIAVEIWRDATEDLGLTTTDVLTLLAVGYRKGCAAGLALASRIQFPSQDETQAWKAGL